MLKFESTNSRDIVLFSIGLTLCLVSALSSVVGVNLQKLSHMKNALKSENQRKNWLKQWRWWCGMLLVILGALFDFASLGFAPQMVVAAFGSFTLIINAWTAPIMLGEHITKAEFASTLIIFFGATLTVVSSPISHDSYTLDDLLERFADFLFLLYVSVVLGLCVIFVLIFLRAEKLKTQNPEQYHKYWFRIHPICIASVSGMLGAQSLLVAKAVVLIIASLINGDTDTASRFQPYLILISLFFFICTQTYTLNAALLRFDAIIVLPVFQVFWITTGVVGAAAFYQEFSDVGTVSKALGILGVAIIAFGIYLLSILHVKAPQTEVQLSIVESGKSRGSAGSISKLFRTSTDLGNAIQSISLHQGFISEWNEQNTFQSFQDEDGGRPHSVSIDFGELNSKRCNKVDQLKDVCRGTVSLYEMRTRE
eukprot:c8137_g1_i1.p1 GENE.c8137_g1_i1~~c8137_g1_i1.p1  ORF type:complete len:424 (-),score=157.26 c8137_g1_i1:11-1282(-)